MQKKNSAAVKKLPMCVEGQHKSPSLSIKRRRRLWEALSASVDRRRIANLQLSKVENVPTLDLIERLSVVELRNELQTLRNELSIFRKKMQKMTEKSQLNPGATVVNNKKNEREVDNKKTNPEGKSSISRFSGKTRTVSYIDKKSRGLDSSFKIGPELKEFWYPLEFSRTLETDVLVPLDLFDFSWVLFRDHNGKPSCIKDSCAHRACPLSLGKVENGELSCAYHGWKFTGDGNCSAMPSTVFVKGISVKAIPCVDVDGLIWVYPGVKTPHSEVPRKITEQPAGYNIHAELLLDVPVEHGLLIENLLDLAHAPFTHTSTFAKGWPVPDLVAFKTVGMLGGHWHPYPIDMSFAPPCMTLSTIGLSQPGKIERGTKQENCENHLHQLHVCLPTGKGRTRLLYRMSLDFIPWIRGLPFMDRVWKRVADEVLNEDLRLVMGQQANLIKEGPTVTWAHPVPYDKLAVRYRRWLNKLSENDD